MHRGSLPEAGGAENPKHRCRRFNCEAVAFPAKDLHDYKFWPHVSRVDNVFGDRNPVCSCAGMEHYS